MAIIQGAAAGSSYTEPIQASGGRTPAVDAQRELLTTDAGVTQLLLAIFERLCCIQLELQILNDSQQTTNFYLDADRQQLDAVFNDPRCMFDAISLANSVNQA